MTTYSIDIAYAYIQLGLEPGVSREELDEVLANASAYRFSTRERVEQVRRLVDFFIARRKLGLPENSFDEIRKLYHMQAMKLHPDRNRGDARAEEQLKLINASYAIVDGIHREARDYYRLSDDERRSIEKDARKTTQRERPEKSAAHERHARHKDSSFTHRAGKPAWDSPKRPGIRYMAASIPRYIRSSRLRYLKTDCIIGCWYIAVENDVNQIFDVIMLPEREFLRARQYLGSAAPMHPSLEDGRFMPVYIPQDVKEVVVPSGEPDPALYAKNHFLKLFGLDKSGTREFR